MSDTNLSSPVLPCVLQLGFAGPRRLFDLPKDFQGSLGCLHGQVREYLIHELRTLPKELSLADGMFLCGVSQIARGADTLFVEACQSEGVPQRIFLPQPVDTYLEAVGSDGTADFSDEERATVRSLLSSPHVIQQSVVSSIADRQSRFEDTSREILRESDILICLIREGMVGKPGGPQQMMQLAKNYHIPVLEIRVTLQNGNASLKRQWHDRESLAAPRLPECLAALTPANGDRDRLPNVAEYCDVVKAHVSARARRHSELFARTAFGVIAAHILATLFATLALVCHGASSTAHSETYQLLAWTSGLLGIELILLTGGLGLHHWLSHRHPFRIWAISRLLAEIHRSVSSLGELDLPLDYLFRIQLPRDLNPLLRTLNILHLRSASKGQDWDALRQAYLQNRLTDDDPKKGQIAYYSHHRDIEELRLKTANAIFLVCSLLAIVATGAKLLLLLLPHLWDSSQCTGVLGTMAIIMPVLAVGSLSWSAAKDYEARVHTYGHMHAFLENQERRIAEAASAREFRQLVEETETRLVRETADWYSRRSFTGVA